MKSLLALSLSALISVSASSAFASETKAAAKPDLAKGEAAFAMCVACHAADGNSTTPVNPKLSQQHPEYLIKQLHEFKSGKRANAVMSGMVAGLSDDDMRNISYWLASKPANTPLFAGKYHRGQSGKRFKIDMAYARKLYVEKSATPEERVIREADDFLRWKDSQGLFADFHAQRTTFVTQLLNSGVPLQQVQKLARHKSPVTVVACLRNRSG